MAKKKIAWDWVLHAAKELGFVEEPQIPVTHVFRSEDNDVEGVSFVRIFLGEFSKSDRKLIHDKLERLYNLGVVWDPLDDYYDIPFATAQTYPQNDYDAVWELDPRAEKAMDIISRFEPEEDSTTKRYKGVELGDEAPGGMKWIRRLQSTDRYNNKFDIDLLIIMTNAYLGSGAFKELKGHFVHNSRIAPIYRDIIEFGSGHEIRNVLHSFGFASSRIPNLIDDNTYLIIPKQIVLRSNKRENDEQWTFDITEFLVNSAIAQVLAEEPDEPERVRELDFKDPKTLQEPLTEYEINQKALVAGYENIGFQTYHSLRDRDLDLDFITAVFKFDTGIQANNFANERRQSLPFDDRIKEHLVYYVGTKRVLFPIAWTFKGNKHFQFLENLPFPIQREPESSPDRGPLEHDEYKPPALKRSIGEILGEDDDDITSKRFSKLEIDNPATLLFCYGSNHPTQLGIRLGRKIKNIQSAYVADYRRVFRGHSSNWGGAVASLERSTGDAVYGYVTEIKPRELPLLDKFEGVASGKYKRIEIEVELEDETATAIAYISTSREPGQPTRSYLDAVAKTINTCWKNDNGSTITYKDIKIR